MQTQERVFLYKLLMLSWSSTSLSLSKQFILYFICPPLSKGGPQPINGGPPSTDTPAGAPFFFCCSSSSSSSSSRRPLTLTPLINLPPKSKATTPPQEAPTGAPNRGPL